MDTCINDPNKSSTTQLNEHEMCGYSLITNCSFDEKRNVVDYYRGKDCQDLRKQANLIINFDKKEMDKLTDEENFKHYIEDILKINALYAINHFLKVKKVIILK